MKKFYEGNWTVNIYSFFLIIFDFLASKYNKLKLFFIIA